MILPAILLIIVIVVLVVGGGAWLILSAAGHKAPQTAVRETEHAELLGPGGPDDPDAGR